ncbi:MAG: DinB family protein, partial [Acidobacteriota bacterium]|nr:DinB family protein [Acidobacteriota bacterium]
MKFESIDEIYVANSNVRKKLLDLIAGLSAEDGDLPTENGKWTVSKIVEHLSKVEDSMMRICRKLLTKAKEKGLAADRSVKISEHF